MTAAKVIEDFMHLPREEQSRVLEFAFELARKRQLSGQELSRLAQRMVDSDDPAEVDRLKIELTRGFHGDSRCRAFGDMVFPAIMGTLVGAYHDLFDVVASPPVPLSFALPRAGALKGMMRGKRFRGRHSGLQAASFVLR